MSKKHFKETLPTLFDRDLLNPPVPTGYVWMDEVLGGGYWRGLPTIVAAESGHGKSLWMKNSSLLMAMDKQYGGLGLNVLVISLELSAEYLAQQYLALLDGTNISSWHTFRMPAEILKDKEKEAMNLARMVPNLYIDDEPHDVQSLLQVIKEASGNFDVIFLDYFQALDVNDKGDGNAFNRASREITRTIKEVKNVALVVLSQVTDNQGLGKKTEAQHKNVKLRSAKQLHNDAVAEIIIFRNQVEEFDEDYLEKIKEINIHIRKNRNGQPDQTHSKPYSSAEGKIGDYTIDKRKIGFIYPTDEEYDGEVEAIMEHLMDFNDQLQNYQFEGE